MSLSMQMIMHSLPGLTGYGTELRRGGGPGLRLKLRRDLFSWEPTEVPTGTPKPCRIFAKCSASATVSSARRRIPDGRWPVV